MSSILTLQTQADDPEGRSGCGGAGLYTLPVRDTAPLSALALSLCIIFDKV